jgi:uncharacterized protein (TIGR03437 family)
MRTHALALCLLTALAAPAQTIDNSALVGKYFFRHLMLTVDSSNTINSSKTLTGSITFDGAGSFNFQGQQVIGASGPASLAGTGKYSITAAGFVALTNPQQTAANMNGRVGVGALVASTTDSGTGTFDILIAIPAPATSVPLSGSYWIASLGFINGAQSQARNAFFTATPNQGSFGTITVNGQAANLGTRNITQTIAGATYSVGNDGSGTATFPLPSGGSASGQLIGGTKVLYVSRDGSIFIAGSTDSGGQDLIIGVQALPATTKNSNFANLYYTAGLLLGSDLEGSAGSASATGQGKLIATNRVHTSTGTVDLTAVNSYNMNADSSGAGPELNNFALGANGNVFIGTGYAPTATNTFQIYVGVRAPTISGAGTYLSPLGVANAASFAPVGASISPGEFITLFGANLSAKTTVSPTVTFPTTLSGVQVMINGSPVPVYSVSPTQISALVPFAITGSTATVQVTGSNTVTVPVAKTSPGIFTVPSAGIGPGAILHADYTLVNAAKPAKVGETVLIFLTGLGPVTPSVPDGAPPNILTDTTAPINVYFGGVAAKPTYKGLSPQYPGLYQINVVLPAGVPSGSNISLAIETPDAFHDQVDIALAP